ncbi:NAD(P)/FAD-dependent oxidoreductase [bacterium]|nr:NAD(P)/FAD-dependent oxidoreductase [candidate division CSSED10-310 bacterium]
MQSEHYVIIGNGPAANSAADILRKGDPDARITLISDEFFPYYHRHLLRHYILGKKSKEDLIVRPISYYRENRIRLRLGQKVVRIDLQTRTVFLAHMEKVHYTRLLICLGGKPRIPEIHYVYSEYFTAIKTIDDAEAFREQLPGIRSMVIVGGDLISVKMAASFLETGMNVRFLIDEDAFWPLKLDDDQRRDFTERLSARGAEVISGDVLAGVEPETEGGFRVRTRNGLSLSCDRIGAFFGLIPDVDFLVGSGLDIDRGILVNEYLQTQFEGVYAAGDCAQVYNPDLKNYWVSIGWDNALHLGQIAAHNILGSDKTADLPPLNLLNSDGVKVQTAWWRDL